MTKSSTVAHQDLQVPYFLIQRQIQLAATLVT